MMGFIYNIWWLYTSLICPVILESFEIVLRASISTIKKKIHILIIILEYG